MSTCRDVVSSAMPRNLCGREDVEQCGVADMSNKSCAQCNIHKAKSVAVWKNVPTVSLTAVCLQGTKGIRAAAQQESEQVCLVALLT